MTLEYYGTNLDQAGHSFYILSENNFETNRDRFNEFPFNPEALPYADRKKEFKKGVVRFYNFAGFTILAISGSSADTRGGSKSVFFVQEDLTREVFESKLKAHPLVQKIIAKMPFDVLW
jgi:hypothetical protein